MLSKLGSFVSSYWTPQITKEDILLRILVIGRPSVGKTSLISALLNRPYCNPVGEVDARSGSTTNYFPFPTDKGEVIFYDSPGIEEYTKFQDAKSLPFTADVILYVTEHAPYDVKELKAFAKLIHGPFILVINKKDTKTKEQLDKITNQWKEKLQEITDFRSFEVVSTQTSGYDGSKISTLPDVEELRSILYHGNNISDDLKRSALVRVCESINQQAWNFCYSQTLLISVASACPGTTITATAIEAYTLFHLQSIYQITNKIGLTDICLLLSYTIVPTSKILTDFLLALVPGAQVLSTTKTTLTAFSLFALAIKSLSCTGSLESVFANLEKTKEPITENREVRTEEEIRLEMMRLQNQIFYDL